MVGAYRAGNEIAIMGQIDVRIISKMNSPRKALDRDTIHPDDCWKLLERAAASQQLRRAPRSREFLNYVAGKSLKEGCTEIHEQEIGHAVFGRDKNYDTSQDNIVRVSATELRKRIDGYFASEGSNEPLIFDIPRGSYLPVFRWRTEEVPTAPEEIVPKVVSIEPPALPPPHPYRYLPLIMVSIVAILLAIGCTLLWKQNRSLVNTHGALEGKPALAAFWPRFLDSSRETDIILADTSYALVEDISKQSFTLSDYLDRTYVSRIQASNLEPTRKADLEMIMNRNNGSLGDFRVAQRILKLDPGSTKLDIAYAREYMADSIERNNVILIGSQKSNPWVDLFYNRLAFTIEYDAALDHTFIKNIHPQAGEQSSYTVTDNPEDPLGYAIIAYLPNPTHTADALIIAGTNSQATDAAGEFLTSELSMERWLQKLHTTHIPYFEVLVKTTRLRGTPLGAEIVAYRTF